MNELLALTVRRELGVPCTAVSDPSALHGPEANDSLLLADDADPSARGALLAVLGDGREARVAPGTVGALFNVDPAVSDVAECLRAGVRGLFLVSDSMEQVMAGLRSLLAGEAWIPRALSGQPAGSGGPGAPVRQPGLLTAREREVLAQVCAGATNDQIARRLSLSTNTVKAHLYSIYKKIDARSRTEAALWAVRHLGVRLSLTMEGPPSPPDEEPRR